MDMDVNENFPQDCNETNGTIVEVGYIIITMASSLASIIGSLLIIISFAIWPDIRTTARAILVFLAIADFFAAAGYMFASIIFLVNFQDFGDRDAISAPLCTFQSFITTVFPVSSFLWTANLAVYLFVAITLQKIKVAKKLVLLFHVTAWGIPLLLCIPGAATGVLGKQTHTVAATQGTVAWCWVSLNNSFDNYTTPAEAKQRLHDLQALELVYGKFWEISTFFVAIVLCTVVKISVHKRKKQLKMETERNPSSYGSMNSERVQAALTQLDQKLIWIPIVFVLVRGWGTMRWLVASTYPECFEINYNCSVHYGRIWYTSECVDVIYNPFWIIMQAIGDTGQGWANALLYVIFHPMIAQRICPCFFVCWNRLVTRFCRICRKSRDYSPMEDSDQGHEVAMSVSTSEHTDPPMTSTDSGVGKSVYAQVPPDRDRISINNSVNIEKA